MKHTNLHAHEHARVVRTRPCSAFTMFFYVVAVPPPGPPPPPPAMYLRKYEARSSNNHNNDSSNNNNSNNNDNGSESDTASEEVTEASEQSSDVGCGLRFLLLSFFFLFYLSSPFGPLSSSLLSLLCLMFLFSFSVQRLSPLCST